MRIADLFQDLKFGARQLLANPGFTIAATLCIALGIGANTVTFSVARTLLFTPPPVERPDELVRLFIDWSSGLKFGSFSYPDYRDLRERSDVFQGVVAEAIRPVHMASGESNERIGVSIVSANYFEELGIELARGRSFSPEADASPGSYPEVVIGHGLWQRRFAGNPAVLGETLVLNRHPFAVVGVTTEAFTGTIPGVNIELWVPIGMQAQVIPGRELLEARGNHWLSFVTARLKPGVSVEQARQSTNVLLGHLAEEYPDTNVGKSIDIYPESEASPHPAARKGFVAFMGLMFAVVGFVLLLACANVAGLLLVRYLARRREMGVRLALGASRGRLVRQLAIESTTLAAFAGGAGLAFAWVLVRVIASARPPIEMPIRVDVGLDPAVLGFSVVVSMCSALFFGVLPALQSTRVAVMPTLREGGGGSGAGTSWLRAMLVSTQVAISLVLLIGAALVVRSLQNAHDLNPGFDPDHGLVASIDLDLQGYDEVAGRAFQRSLRESLESLPAVTAVGLSEVFPLTMTSQQNGALPEGYLVPEGSDRPSIDFNIVDHGYFESMGIPILRGRGVAESDDGDGTPVLVVNEAFAERFWPGKNPVGKRVESNGRDHEVVGLVPTGRYQTLGEEPKPYIYYSAFQRYRGETTIQVRVEGEADALLAAVRSEVRRLDPTLPVTDLKTMHGALGFSLLPARMAAGVVSVFALLALLLAATGLYGVVSYSVRQRTRDIGIRIALGANSRAVLGFVLASGFRLTLAGLGVGVVLGLGLSRFIASLLYGVGATDVVSFASAIVALMAVAVAASVIPARRATRVDPVEALKAD